MRSVGVRIKDLRTKQLPKLGAYWRGTPEEFTEFLLSTIVDMPTSVNDAMWRYYVDGDTQQVGDTGRPQTKDSRFYLFVLQGRSILATLLRTAQTNSKTLRVLEDIYGRARD